LPLGGFGISRYTLDEYLYKKAIGNGCKIIKDTVESIVFDNEKFTVTTSDKTILKFEIVIGAFGKRSNIDQKLNRNFIQKKSQWLAVKAHYSGDFPNNLVGLHNFKGGYCGVSKVENNIINICYLADYKTFKQFKNKQSINVKLVIVGEKYYWTKEIKQTFLSLNCKADIIFTGRLSTEDLNTVIGSALAMVYVPYFEGFGIPILEAMNCDTPVITSNITSMPEVAKDAAVLVDPLSVDSIANGMNSIYTDENLRNSLIEKGRKRRMDFSWDKTADLLWKSSCVSHGARLP